MAHTFGHSMLSQSHWCSFPAGLLCFLCSVLENFYCYVFRFIFFFFQ